MGETHSGTVCERSTFVRDDESARDNDELPFLDANASLSSQQVLIPLQCGSTTGQECRSPLRVALLLGLSFFLIFMDRGSIGTNAVNGHPAGERGHASGLRGEFEMSNFQNGFIPACLLTGRILGVAVLSRPPLGWPPMFVAASGMLLWTVGAVGCGASFCFHLFALCRFLMGVGQAPFIGFTLVVLDDVAPADRVATWMTVYQMGALVGMGTGYFYGSLVGSILPWRCAFYIEAVLALPLVVLSFAEKKFYFKSALVQEGEDESLPKSSSLFYDVKTLFSYRLFVLSLVGSAMLNGYGTAFEYWAPRALEGKYESGNADVAVGVCLLVGALVTAAVGGRILDDIFGTTLKSAMGMAGVCMTLLWTVMLFGELAVANYLASVIILCVASTLICMPLGAIGGLIMWTVPANLRHLAKSFEGAVSQLIGTIPAPAVYGAMLDCMEERKSLENSHRIAMMTVNGFTFLGSLLFLFGFYISSRKPR